MILKNISVKFKTCC